MKSFNIGESMNNKYLRYMASLLIAMLGFSFLYGQIEKTGAGRVQITAFMNAVSKGDIAHLKEYIEKGGDINVQDMYGNTALMEAVHLERDIPMVEELLRAKAKIDVTNTLGWTALMIAAAFGNVQAVRLLLDAHADIRIKNNENKNALQLVEERAKEYRDFGEPSKNYEDIIQMINESMLFMAGKNNND